MKQFNCTRRDGDHLILNNDDSGISLEIFAKHEDDKMIYLSNEDLIELKKSIEERIK